MIKRIWSYLAATTFFISTVLGVLAPLKVGAAVGTCTWTNGGGNNLFNNAANWSGCDGAGIPENGDSLVFPTSVDSDTTGGDDRELNNNISSLSVAGITVSGTYPDADSDAYTITGNALTLTGNVIGNTGSDYKSLNIEVALTASVTLDIRRVSSTQGLAIGSSTVTTKSSYFAGGVSGSGTLTIDEDPTVPNAGGGDGCDYTDGTAPTQVPFRGDSSSFSGALVINDSTVGVSSRTTDLARHSSSITLNSAGSLSFRLNHGQDMTFAVPLVLNGGTIITSQEMSNSSCNPPTAYKTLNISGTVTANQPSEVSMTYTNVVMSGTVTGADKISVTSGQQTTSTLTIGSTTKKSPEKTTTYTGDQNGTSVSAMENNIIVIAAGAKRDIAFVMGGTLKGTGTVNSISMTSGKVAPGLSPGCLASGNITYTGGGVEIEIGGKTACTEYDQQVVTGTVALGSAVTTLTVNRFNNFYPKAGDAFTIISNDAADAVTGTFKDLAEAATFTQDGVTYRINYGGGDGNDVVLTVVAVPGAPNTGAKPRQALTSLAAMAIGLLVVSGALLVNRRKQTKN